MLGHANSPLGLYVHKFIGYYKGKQSPYGLYLLRIVKFISMMNISTFKVPHRFSIALLLYNIVRLIFLSV